MSGRCYADTERYKHFKANCSAIEAGDLIAEHPYVEVRYDSEQTSPDQESWTVDEICTTQVHLEGMNQDAVWMSINGLHVWFRAIRVKGDRRPHLIVTCFPNDCKPYVVKPGEGTLEGREWKGRGATP